jgi:uncharacterized protein
MFIGREKEINYIYEVFNRPTFEFGIVHGRRRVGKTTLIKEAIKDRNSIYFLAQQANMQMNLEMFSKQYGKFKGLGQVIYNSFFDLFKSIFESRDLIVVIDEFTYLTEVDRSFESMLQGLIDEYKDKTNIKVIVSGSEIGMYENLFSHSKPLFNRQTFSLHLKECDYYESALYYQRYDDEDKIRTYAVFGGLPFYLCQIDDNVSLKDNICKLIISENARFSSEVQMLLTSELRSIQEYQSVLQAIHSGSTKLAEIDSKSGIKDSSKTIKYVNKLIELEIIEKEHRFMDSPNSKKHLYKIKNNFIAFYYRFIWKHASAKVLMDPIDFYETFIEDDLDQFVSIRFEKMCEQYLIRKFKIRHQKSLIQIGRYWYNDRKLQKDIEIDICALTKEGVIVYECKWTNEKVTQSTMEVLKLKGKELNAISCGAFSRNGFSNSFDDDNHDLISIEEMFN